MRLFVFYLSHGLVCIKELSHMGKINGNPNLVWKKLSHSICLNSGYVDFFADMLEISLTLISQWGVPAATSNTSRAVVDGKLRHKDNAFLLIASSFFISVYDTVCHTVHLYSRIGLAIVYSHIQSEKIFDDIRAISLTYVMTCRI